MASVSCRKSVNRPDGLALPFGGAFGLAVSFGSLGHFLPAQRPALLRGVYRALRPGGIFAFPVAAPLPVTAGFTVTTLPLTALGPSDPDADASRGLTLRGKVA